MTYYSFTPYELDTDGIKSTLQPTAAAGVYVFFDANAVAVASDAKDFEIAQDERINCTKITKTAFGKLVASSRDYAMFNEALERTREFMLTSLNYGFEAAMTALNGSKVPASETLSWSAQEEQAAAFVAGDANADTSMLQALAAARGVDVAVLAAKILEKAKHYRDNSAALIGKRQKLEAEILAAASEYELGRIDVAF